MNHRGTETQRDKLTEKVIGLAIEVHRQLGPGLLESVYQKCLCHELQQNGIQFQSKVELPVFYKGMTFEHGFRLDIVIQNMLILELKNRRAAAPCP